MRKTVPSVAAGAAATATLGLAVGPAVRHAGDDLRRRSSRCRARRRRTTTARSTTPSSRRGRRAVDELTDPAGIAALAACALALDRADRRRGGRGAAAPGARGAAGGARRRSKTDLVAPRRRAAGGVHARCTSASRRSRRGSRTRVGGAEARLDGAITYRALVRYDAYGELSGPPVRVARAARRGAQRRRALLDHAPRDRAAVLQAGRRRPRRAPPLAGGGRGDPARAGGRARLGRCWRTDARRATSGRRGPTRTTRCSRRAPTSSPVALPTVPAVVAAVQDGRDRARARPAGELARGRGGRDARRARLRRARTS